MKITCLIACVNYDDFLSLTLDRNKKHFDELIVITSPKDENTQALCTKHNVRFVLTDAYYTNGDVFNKGRAFNKVLDSLIDPDIVCTVDADTILPSDFREQLEASNLKKDCLYSAPRRMCPRLRKWDQYKLRPESWGRFKLEDTPIRKSKDGAPCLWGSPELPTSNPAGIFGYLQIWHEDGQRFSEEYKSAEGYDVEFGMRWAEDKRINLPNMEVIHLGWTKTNWKGRLTKRWDTANFLVVCTARTGSTFVVDSIDNHPSVVCAHEVFHNDPKIRTYHTERHGIANEWVPGANQEQFLREEIWPLGWDKKAVGCKILYYQFKHDFWDTINNGTKIIHLVRNPIATYVSRLEATETGQWHAEGKEEVTQPPPVTVDLEELHNHIHFVLRRCTRLRETVTPDLLLEVDYKDIVNNYAQEMNRIYNFLGAKDHMPTTTQKKLRSFEFKNRIENYTELREEFPEFFNDSLI